MGERGREAEGGCRRPELLLVLLLLLLPDSTVAIKPLRLCTVPCLHMHVFCTACSKAHRKHGTTIHKKHPDLFIFMDHTKSMNMQPNQSSFAVAGVYIYMCACVCDYACVWGPVGAEEGQRHPQISRSGEAIPQSGAIPNTVLLSFSFRGKSLVPACFCTQPQKICGSQH